MFLFRRLILSFTLCLPAALSANSDRDELFNTITSGDAALVTRLLNSGADPDMRNPSDRLCFQTPLAVELNRPEMMELLLDHGADIDLCVGFRSNLSPLYLAVTDSKYPQ